MKKKKKLPIIIGIVLGLLAIAGVILFFTLRQSKITVTFLDGTNTVKELKLKKGKTIKLPDISKEGYIFNGWYFENTKIEDGVWFDHDVVIRARWLQAEASKMTITFDTDGGKSIESTTIECDTTLNLPTPTKDGYKFINWLDKNEVVITNETKLVCEDVTLKAKWEKIETKSTETTKTEEKKNTETKTNTKENEEKKTEETKPAENKQAENKVEEKNDKPTKDESKKVEVKKEYTCPDGYTLNDTKCTIEAPVKEKCGERGFDYDGKCVTISANDRKEGERGCPKKFITYKSYASETNGELVYAGTYFCYYYKVSAADEATCTQQSGQYGNFVWRQSNSSCYVTRTTASMICDNLTGYIYIANPNTYEGVNGLNGGCYPLTDKTKYCSDGYVLTNNKCIKTIDATLK